MQKTRAKIPVYLMTVLVIASCVLRFFQLLKYTDSKTGYVIEGSNISLITYIVLIGAIAVGAFYSKNKTQLSQLLDFEKKSRGEFLASSFLSLAFFADFIHQAYNCYSYISRFSYVEYVYLIPLIVSGVLAVLCSFYFAGFALTAKGSNYDFRNFTFFHFVSVLWCFTRLVMMMLKIIDIRLGIENMLEFLLLVFLIMFFFCYISMVDNKGEASRLFVFFAAASLMLAVILVVPRYVLAVIGEGSVLSKVDYTGLTYIAAGVFAVTLSAKTIRTD